MADHRVATGGPDLVRAAASLALAPGALAPAISDPAYRVLVGSLADHDDSPFTKLERDALRAPGRGDFRRPVGGERVDRGAGERQEYRAALRPGKRLSRERHDAIDTLGSVTTARDGVVPQEPFAREKRMWCSCGS